jgi:C-terminal processing protease CtpA/Prc
MKNYKVFLVIIVVALSINIPNVIAQNKQVYGIGVSFQIDPSFDMLPLVTDVVAATSAFTVGVQKGWHIVAVDDIQLKGKQQNDILKMIRGNEGTYVKITFAKSKNLKDLQDFIIMRRKIPVKE